MVRRALSVLLALTFTLSLAACSSKGGSASGSSSPDQVTEIKVAAAADSR